MPSAARTRPAAAVLSLEILYGGHWCDDLGLGEPHVGHVAHTQVTDQSPPQPGQRGERLGDRGRPPADPARRLTASTPSRRSVQAVRDAAVSHPISRVHHAFPITAVVSAWLECCGHHDVSAPHTTRSGCGGVGSPRWLPAARTDRVAPAVPSGRSAGRHGSADRHRRAVARPVRCSGRRSRQTQSIGHRPYLSRRPETGVNSCWATTGLVRAWRHWGDDQATREDATDGSGRQRPAPAAASIRGAPIVQTTPIPPDNDRHHQ
jgi:hypothetical protein